MRVRTLLSLNFPNLGFFTRICTYTAMYNRKIDNVFFFNYGCRTFSINKLFIRLKIFHSFKFIEKPYAVPFKQRVIWNRTYFKLLTNRSKFLIIRLLTSEHHKDLCLFVYRQILAPLNWHLFDPFRTSEVISRPFPQLTDIICILLMP